MASTQMPEELKAAVEEARRTIADAVVKLMADLPAGMYLDSVTVHLMTVETLGGDKQARLDGISITVEF